MPTVHLQIDEEFASLQLGDVVRRAAEAALAHEDTPANAELSVVLTDDAQLRALNRDYLDEDAVTDVLSFPSGETDPESGALYLGDIVISIPRAQAQAQESGHSLEDEIQLLTVHGALHLLGHDHADEDEKARMWAAQGEILAGLGLKIRLPE